MLSIACVKANKIWELLWNIKLTQNPNCQNSVTMYHKRENYMLLILKLNRCLLSFFFRDWNWKCSTASRLVWTKKAYWCSNTNKRIAWDWKLRSHNTFCVHCLSESKETIRMVRKPHFMFLPCPLFFFRFRLFLFKILDIFIRMKIYIFVYISHQSTRKWWLLKFHVLIILFFDSEQYLTTKIIPFISHWRKVNFA